MTPIEVNLEIMINYSVYEIVRGFPKTEEEFNKLVKNEVNKLKSLISLSESVIKNKLEDGFFQRVGDVKFPTKEELHLDKYSNHTLIQTEDEILYFMDMFGIKEQYQFLLVEMDRETNDVVEILGSNRGDLSDITKLC